MFLVLDVLISQGDGQIRVSEATEVTGHEVLSFDYVQTNDTFLDFTYAFCEFCPFLVVPRVGDAHTNDGF